MFSNAKIMALTSVLVGIQIIGGIAKDINFYGIPDARMLEVVSNETDLTTGTNETDANTTIGNVTNIVNNVTTLDDDVSMSSMIVTKYLAGVVGLLIV